MIEVYAFLAAFAVLVLAVSVLIPFGYTRSVRAWATRMPIERFAELGVDFSRDQTRYLARYRMLNAGIAVLGLLLLGWLCVYMQHADWDRKLVVCLATVYYLLHGPPLLYVARHQNRHYQMLISSFPERKRKALLQRRGLFDFVSPVAVFLAIAVYFAFAALVFYLRQHPFPGFGGLANIVIVTLVYALHMRLIYWRLYGRKNPFVTPEEREQSLALKVKFLVYVPIAGVVWLSILLILSKLSLQQWEPFGLAIFYVVCALLAFWAMTAPPRRPDTQDTGTGERLTTGTPDLTT